MAAAGITITKDREEVVDFSIPFWQEPSAVIVKRITHDIDYL